MVMMQSSSSDAFVKEKLSLLVTSTRPINLTKGHENLRRILWCSNTPSLISAIGVKMSQIKRAHYYTN